MDEVKEAEIIEEKTEEKPKEETKEEFFEIGDRGKYALITIVIVVIIAAIFWFINR